jgi:hypothetical protein
MHTQHKRYRYGRRSSGNLPQSDSFLSNISDCSAVVRFWTSIDIKPDLEVNANNQLGNNMNLALSAMMNLEPRRLDCEERVG